MDCTYCNRKMDPTGARSLLEYTADHVYPARQRRVLFRSLTFSELYATVPCCWHCNQIKREMLFEQWVAFMEANPRWWERPQLAKSRGDGARVIPQMSAAETSAWLRKSGEAQKAVDAIQARFPGAQLVAVRL